MKSEHLEKAEHDAAFLRDDLRAALREASTVEGLLILPMIEAAAELHSRVKGLREAMRMDAEAV